MNSGAFENSGAEVEATWHVNNNLTLTTNHSVLHMVHHAIAAPEYKGYLGATWHSGKWMVTGGLQQLAGQMNAGFPMPRATFMGGVNISF